MDLVVPVVLSDKLRAAGKRDCFYIHAYISFRHKSGFRLFKLAPLGEKRTTGHR